MKSWKEKKKHKACQTDNTEYMRPSREKALCFGKILHVMLHLSTTCQISVLFLGSRKKKCACAGHIRWMCKTCNDFICLLFFFPLSLADFINCLSILYCVNSGVFPNLFQLLLFYFVLLFVIIASCKEHIGKHPQQSRTTFKTLVTFRVL